jgi:hypothetical protein
LGHAALNFATVSGFSGCACGGGDPVVKGRLGFLNRGGFWVGGNKLGGQFFYRAQRAVLVETGSALEVIHREAVPIFQHIL